MKALGKPCVCHAVWGWSHRTKVLLQARFPVIVWPSSFLMTQFEHCRGNEDSVHTLAVEFKGRNCILPVENNTSKNRFRKNKQTNKKTAQGITEEVLPQIIIHGRLHSLISIAAKCSGAIKKDCPISWQVFPPLLLKWLSSNIAKKNH